MEIDKQQQCIQTTEVWHYSTPTVSFVFSTFAFHSLIFQCQEHELLVCKLQFLAWSLSCLLLMPVLKGISWKRKDAVQKVE